MRFVNPAIVTAAIAAATVAAPALAQSYDAPTASTRTGGDLSPFTGAHVELTTGIDHLKASGVKDNGVQYGISGGYDVASASGFLFGVEGEVADSTTRECDRAVVIATDRLCVKAKRDLYAGGRAGFVSGNTLIYGKVGYTNARVGATYQDGTAGTVNDFSDSTNLDGVRVGGGLEYNTGRFLVKAEYRYSNYENDVTRHQGVVGVGVRF